jgi:1-aminocyclopropane-1-carboxylate deaminase/D-cysteine desulfhydrase-like pyridoxal-dependent ACC family enzyme
MLGSYPTPVQKLDSFSAPAAELWVKRDDLSGVAYGGNKVRKLEHILELARHRGASRIMTIGAVGSNHVLATTIYARRAGLRVAAILLPQPRTEHVISNLRAAIAAGLEAYPAASASRVPFALLGHMRPGDIFVAPGGSSVAASTGYVDAIRELNVQICRGQLPMPDALVLALGSAGTAAGVLAGIVELRLPIKVVGVRVVSPVLMGKFRTLILARSVASNCGIDASWSDLADAFELQAGYLGTGYGHRTEKGDRATQAAVAYGLQLDPTYTAKTFAAALDLVHGGKYKRVLYWHTLSSAPLCSLLEAATPFEELPTDLRCLVRSADRQGGTRG